MNPDQDTIEPFDPAHNPADTATDFEGDDRDDEAVEAGSPVEPQMQQAAGSPVLALTGGGTGG